MRIVSWNVNGLRACARKGFLEWLSRSRAAIVGVQEVRAREDDLPPDVRRPERWHTYFAGAERAGYSGVGLFTRRPLDAVEVSLGVRRFDVEGRVQIARLGRLVVVNAYFPKGSGPARDNSRVPYKLAFSRRLFDLLEPHRLRGARILVMGDLNTAHEEIDLARPAANRAASGFLPVERREVGRWIRAGWVDTFRRFHREGGHYTWWRQWGAARERNVGWRIDYVLASAAAMRFVRRAFILTEIRGSDHCPVGVDVDGAILGPSADAERKSRTRVSRRPAVPRDGAGGDPRIRSGYR